jgi:hypothetical protein
VGATVKGDRRISLRRSQVRSARAWGVGLRFVDPMVTRLYATELLRSAAGQLAALVAGLFEIDRETGPSFQGKLCLSGSGRRFEQLVMDILNGDKVRAQRASLADDLLRQTDLLFDLRPGRAVAVQVSTVIDRDLHDRKIRRLRGREELVTLTPRLLARAVQGPGAEGLLSEQDLSAIRLSACASDEEGLARHLHTSFLRAIHDPCNHPLGPAATLPPPIIRLVTRFVEREAELTCRAQLAA